MIEIHNVTRSSIDESFLKKVAERVLKEEKSKESGLSIAIVGSRRSRQLNLQYRGKDKPANVLSFPFGKESTPSEVEGFGLGEVVISPEQVKKDAKEYGMRFERALAWMLIHGILHLLDYDHEKSEPLAKRMEKRESDYLSLFFDKS